MNKPRLPLDIEFLMESILQENPDGVPDETGYEFATWYGRSPAYAFMTFEHFNMIGLGVTHHAMVDFCYDTSKKERPLDYFKTVLEGRRDVQVSSEEGFFKNLTTGKLGEYIRMGGRRAPGADGGNKDVEKYRTGLGLTGRIWTEKKLISFWNGSSEVVNQWDKVEKLFKDFADTLGKLEEYQVDFIERMANPKKPLVPASSISSSRSNDGKLKPTNQMDFLEKLSPEKLAALQKKLHTMKPAEKKRALQALGAGNFKAAEIADKLGMSVAQFNHIMNVNEGEDDKMPNLADLAKQLGKQ